MRPKAALFDFESEQTTDYAFLSGLYIFALRRSRKVKPMELPKYPDARVRKELYLVLGEVHDPRQPLPAEQPYWLKVSERGLFTGIAIFGAIGTGKTSGCMYPYAEQQSAIANRQC